MTKFNVSYDTDIGNIGDLFSLEGKVAVVTGGSRGLGLSGASGLIQAGCSKVYITSRKAQACEEACRVLNALPSKRPGAQAISVPSNGSTVAGIEHLVREVSKTTDHVDILFANAGAAWGAPFEEHDEKSWNKVMDLNVKAVFFCVQKFSPLLTARATVSTPSRVIATASVGGLSVEHGGANSVPSYAASKAAVIHLMRHLALQLGDRHVLCNSIAPGFFPTSISEVVIRKAGGLERMAEMVPAGRLGTPADIAGTLVWLCSRAGSHVDGEVVELDGARMWNHARL